MTSTKNCREELNSLQQQFYEENGKNTFFKNKQKTECAKMICSKYSKEDLIQNTVYQIGDTNKIIIDYTIFKCYMNPDIYQEFIYYIFNIFNKVLSLHSCYEIHINLDSLTISAAERYKDIIKMYNDESTKNSTQFVDYLKIIKLYNLPSILDAISKMIKPIINADAYNKIIIVPKNDSDRELQNILDQIQN